ncbi:MAG: serine protease [Gemmataceae bacterium]
MRSALYLTALLPIALPSVAVAQKAPTSTPLTGKEIYQQTLKATVWVMRAEDFTEGSTRGTRVTGTGTGSLIDVQNRLVVTNYHVVRDSKLAVIFFPAFDKKKDLIPEREHYLKEFRANRGVRGTVLAAEPKMDLALIQLPKEGIPPGTPALRLARESVGPGDTVHSIGNPGASGALWVYTPGGVKAVYRKEFTTGSKTGKEQPFRIEARVVETTSPVNSGDSGGPVVNGAGELVAVTQGHIAEDAARSISYFIDVSELKALLKKHNFTRIITAPPSAEVVVAPKPEPPAKAVAASASDDRDKKEKTAQQKLDLAKQFQDNPTTYRKRLTEIVKDFSETKAAAEAKELLDKIK